MKRFPANNTTMYQADVQHSRAGLTSYKQYLQIAALWVLIKEHGLHNDIAAAAIGQHACDAVLVEEIGLPYTAQLAAREELQNYCVVNHDCGLWSPVVHHWDNELETMEVHGRLKSVYTDFSAAADAVSNRHAADFFSGIAIGAAKGGCLVLCADALMKGRITKVRAQALLKQNASADCAAQSSDIAAFNMVLRICVLMMKVGSPYDVDRGHIRRLRHWHAAAEGNIACCDSEIRGQTWHPHWIQLQGGPHFRVENEAQLRLCILDTHDFKTPLMWSLAKYGAPMLLSIHASFSYSECRAHALCSSSERTY
jgi:hypothetical protein